MNYYIVKCKLGHSGTGQYREILFNIKAKNASDAIDKAKKMPGVKHDSNTAILGLKQITEEQYKENRKERMEYLKNKKRISDYDSENLTYNLIEEVIKENNFDNLDIVVHIPLIDILANDDLLNEEEKSYANNDWTHIDFVIFNKMDKKMVLAIEVDGYYYHKEGTKQQERDKLKDRILEKYEVPLIRFSTTGSGEKKILEKKIREIFAN